MERFWKHFDDDTWIQAWLAYTAAIFLNLFVLFSVAERLLHSTWQANDVVVLFMGGLIAMSTYFSLGSRNGMRAILVEFADEPPGHARRNSEIVVVYFALSFLLVLVEVIVFSSVY